MSRSTWLLVALCACGRIGFDDLGGGDGGVDPRALRLEPARTSVNLSSVIDLAAAGGAPPYVYTVTAGSVTAAGTFRCPARAEQVLASVSDDVGDIAEIEITCGGEQLFLIGGARTSDGVVLDEILASPDGVTWSLHGRLPMPEVFGVAVVFDDFIYVIGGGTMAMTYLDPVWRSSDGIQWEQVGSVPEPFVSSAIAVHREQIWLIGGFKNPLPDTPATYRSSDGAAWTRVADVPAANHDAYAVTRGGWLYVVGGHFADQVHRTIDGSSWETLPGRLTISVDNCSMGELGDRVVYASGIDNTSSVTDDLRPGQQARRSLQQRRRDDRLSREDAVPVRDARHRRPRIHLRDHRVTAACRRWTARRAVHAALISCRRGCRGRPARRSRTSSPSS